MKVKPVNDIREVIRQLQQGRSRRATAEALGISRNTVARYADFAGEKGWLSGEQPLPGEAELAEAIKTINAGSTPVAHKLDDKKDQIMAWRAQGVNLRVILKTLNAETPNICAYATLWGFVTRLEARAPDVTMRIETAPGEEAQVDFGEASWQVYDPRTKTVRKAWKFVMTLSYSRHQFVKYVFDQRVETWQNCHKDAFVFFGGVPKHIRIDNLKAAITRACLHAPQIQKAYREFAEHYGFLITPCRVATPRHKGKVEAGVKYVSGNFEPGRAYDNPACDVNTLNRDVRKWVLEVAGTRIHGTTKRQPLTVFASDERPALLALPTGDFDVARWMTAKLGRDCHVSIDGAYYSAPHRFAGQMLDVRVSDTAVELYAEHTRVATHTRAREAGQRQTHTAHLPERLAEGLEQRSQAIERCKRKAAEIGPYTRAAVETLLQDKVLDPRSRLLALIRIADKHSKQLLERACKHALNSEAVDPANILATIKHCLSGQALTASEPSEDIANPSPCFARSTGELLGVAA